MKPHLVILITSLCVLLGACERDRARRKASVDQTIRFLEEVNTILMQGQTSRSCVRRMHSAAAFMDEQRERLRGLLEPYEDFPNAEERVRLQPALDLLAEKVERCRHEPTQDPRGEDVYERALDRFSTNLDAALRSAE